MDRRPQDTKDENPAGAPETAGEWSTFLESRLNYPVGVVFGRSRTYPIQVRPAKAGQPKQSTLVVRMHSMFADAPLEVAESVARWIRSGKRAQRASAMLDRWIEERSAELPARTVARERLVPGGDVHDLERLARELVAGPLAADFPDGTPLPHLTWGRRGRSKTRRSLRLGSFDLEANLVRLHPVLDQAAVPEWFVRYVLFHELLHAAIPPVRGKGARWVHHGPQFRRREHAYADHARALTWEEKNLPALIRSARADRPIAVKTRLQGFQRLFRF
ncbi:MAG: hypothetical protein ACI8QZ_004414 [Chlamydiales bacterium]|jgi:hypothetical protein